MAHLDGPVLRAFRKRQKEVVELSQDYPVFEKELLKRYTKLCCEVNHGEIVEEVMLALYMAKIFSKERVAVPRDSSREKISCLLYSSEIIEDEEIFEDDLETISQLGNSILSDTFDSEDSQSNLLERFTVKAKKWVFDHENSIPIYGRQKKILQGITESKYFQKLAYYNGQGDVPESSDVDDPEVKRSIGDELGLVVMHTRMTRLLKKQANNEHRPFQQIIDEYHRQLSASGYVNSKPPNQSCSFTTIVIENLLQLIFVGSLFYSRSDVEIKDQRFKALSERYRCTTYNLFDATCEITENDFTAICGLGSVFTASESVNSHKDVLKSQVDFFSKWLLSSNEIMPGSNFTFGALKQKLKDITGLSFWGSRQGVFPSTVGHIMKVRQISLHDIKDENKLDFESLEQQISDQTTLKAYVHNLVEVRGHPNLRSFVVRQGYNMLFEKRNTNWDTFFKENPRRVATMVKQPSSFVITSQFLSVIRHVLLGLCFLENKNICIKNLIGQNIVLDEDAKDIVCPRSVQLANFFSDEDVKPGGREAFDCFADLLEKAVETCKVQYRLKCPLQSDLSSLLDYLKKPGFSLERILGHPVFWHRGDSINYLIRVQFRAKVEKLGNFRLYQTEFEQKVCANWRDAVQARQSLKSTFDKPDVRYTDSIVCLLRLIRNCHSHIMEMPNDTRPASVVQLEMTVQDMFPCLVQFIYDIWGPDRDVCLTCGDNLYG